MISLTFGLGALEAEFWRWLFIMTRIGAALLAAPFFGATGVPPQARIVVTGAVGVLVCNWTGVQAPPALFSLDGMLAVAGEVLVGASLGFVLQLSFAAPTIAAEVIGAGMGMSIAAAADPQTGAHSPALGQYYGVVLTLVFLGLGGHLMFIDLVIKSYASFPPGHTWLGPERIGAITGFGTQMFITAVAIALPVTLILLLVQFAAGVVSRAAPSLNLFSLGLPAGVLAGLAALIVSAPLTGDMMADLSAQALRQAEGVLLK
ncbi:flagellar biosynthetic protein FliR [Novosphingobium flavum]|uniref:Flagellar biosynthetic protein FliR n=1 Tax=Novosphingobium aerophilum TaxID=2839843 RepID=A0A7X1F859_9SPHN|nr:MULTISPECIES: flagellar biosynthetic protein FliR [Novosphingobium]MBC2652125.1 flagellar biosynthetic protein FliR [Novosphingobium aerophilum]MBC2661082.1 flagellar biosynthetic protein FliR [Novosphingobium aerophilum]